MKRLQFENRSAQKVYDSYIRRIERTIKSLSKSDQKEIVMELNSHIYAALETANRPKDDLGSIVRVTDELGDPEVILSPMVEERSITRATKTFNPLHIAKALLLNIKNGIIYSIYIVLYSAITICLIALGFKILYPNTIGFLVNPANGDWHIGRASNPNYQEVLGHWFVPSGLAVLVILYIMLTLSMRLRKKQA